MSKIAKNLTNWQFSKISDVLGICAIFSGKVIAGQCIMHKIIGVILVLDNQVKQPYLNVINNVYAVQFSPQPLKFSATSRKNDFLTNIGFNIDKFY